MKIWVDAQLSFAVVKWLTASLNVEAVALKDASLRDAEDAGVFFAARKHGAIVMTKDADFVELLLKHGPPPQVLWITCGNTSNARLKELLAASWDDVVELLKKGEPLIEIGGRAK